MAQRTGADGLLGPKAKVPSAGAIPALVAVLLLSLAGCGGGDPETTAKQAAGSGASTAQAPDSSSSQGEGQAPPSSAQGARDVPTSGAKHGPHIKPPKGAPERAPSAAEKAESTLASMSLTSPDFPPRGSEYEIPAAYTCEGKGSWPTLQWSGVPEGTEELTLFVLNLEPIEEALFFDWAVAGIDPGLGQIEAGKLPRGVTLGKNSFGKEGYELCPPKGRAETIIFALYALPESLSPKRGFDPAPLREEILGLSGNVGLMAGVYRR